MRPFNSLHHSNHLLTHGCFSAVVKAQLLYQLLFTCAQLDGVFLLHLMEHNANRCEAANVLNEIYKEFELGKKRVRSQQPRRLAQPLDTRHLGHWSTLPVVAHPRNIEWPQQHQQEGAPARSFERVPFDAVVSDALLPRAQDHPNA